MALINYDVAISPAQPTVTLDISATLKEDSDTSGNPSAKKPKKLYIAVEVDSIDLSISVKPSKGTVVGGAIAGAVLGPFGSALSVGTLFGVGEFIEKQLEEKIPAGIKGKKEEKEIGTLGYTIKNVEGVDIKIEAETLSLSTHDGMLMATGTLKVS